MAALCLSDACVERLGALARADAEGWVLRALVVGSVRENADRLEPDFTIALGMRGEAARDSNGFRHAQQRCLHMFASAWNSCRIGARPCLGFDMSVPLPTLASEERDALNTFLSAALAQFARLDDAFSSALSAAGWKPAPEGQDVELWVDVPHYRHRCFELEVVCPAPPPLAPAPLPRPVACTPRQLRRAAAKQARQLQSRNSRTATAQPPPKRCAGGQRGQRR